jgi:hypothetical protein
MDYELYHDESQVEGYWHGILLVPVATKSLFLKYLHDIRQKIGYGEPISLKNVKEENRVFSCAEAWVLFAIGAMISTSKRTSYPILFKKELGGKLGYCSYEDEVGHLIKAKYILFRERDSLNRISDMLDHGGKVETTFRMGLKGGLNFLGSEEEPINIVKIHFDGYEHYGRTVDENRIIQRMSGLRNYCTFTKDIKYIIDERTSNHKKQNSQPYEDCQFLQLTDLLVGSFRVALGYITNSKGLHERIAEPVKYLIDKYNEGYARMQNSRWKNSFCMSQCYLDEGQWIFEPVESARKDINKQLNLYEKAGSAS